MSGSAPAAPDPVATANAQAAANATTALTQHQLNMIDQYNPYGSVTYQQIGNNFTPGSGIGTSRYYYNPETGEYKEAGAAPSNPFAAAAQAGKGTPSGWEVVQGTLVPRYSQTTSLSPEQQAIFDQTQQTQQNLANLATQQSANLAQHLGNSFSFTNDDAAQWAYDLASPRILQQQGQNEAALRSTLAAKGIREGSAAWDAEMSRLTNANTDQLNQLALQGRGQAYNEAFNNYTAPINTITALMSGSQVGSPASASPATPQTAVANTDYSGLVQQNYQNQVNAHNSKMGGIGGLFGSALGAIGQAGGIGAFFSDRRLKENIKRVGQTDAGVPIYTYNYVWGGPTVMGVMSDEVDPSAVVKHENGFDMVKYGEIR